MDFEQKDQQQNLIRTSSTLMEAEKARAVQEVQASIVSAKKFPRDEMTSESKMIVSCKRYSMAEQAIYAYPRGGETVRGASIRLAEMMAAAWGNLEYGFKELEQNQGYSVVESFCHDLETNVKVKRVVTVNHKIKSGKIFKDLIDPRDVYEVVANNAQRRVRACILEIIPGDIVDKMVTACNETMKKGEKSEPHIDRIKRMVLAFQSIGVSKDMIETRVKHKVDLITPEEIAELTQIYNSLKDGMTKREDWFDFGIMSTEGKAAELMSALVSPTTNQAPAGPLPSTASTAAPPTTATPISEPVAPVEEPFNFEKHNPYSKKEKK